MSEEKKEVTRLEFKLLDRTNALVEFRNGLMRQYVENEVEIALFDSELAIENAKAEPSEEDKVFKGKVEKARETYLNANIKKQRAIIFIDDQLTKAGITIPENSAI